MYNADVPPKSELPSSGTLLRSTAIAAGVALLLLVTVILPAEYGVDPTGIGRVLGLTQMGELKMELAEEAATADAAEAAARQAGVATPASGTAADTASSQMAAADSATNSHVTRITLRPNEGKEVKLAMREGASVNYAWTTEGGVVNFDTHGDPVDAPRGFYHGYGKGTGRQSDEGVLVAAFDGTHGWFWRNRTGSEVTVTLRTDGAYQELLQLD